MGQDTQVCLTGAKSDQSRWEVWREHYHDLCPHSLLFTAPVKNNDILANSHASVTIRAEEIKDSEEVIIWVRAEGRVRGEKRNKFLPICRWRCIPRKQSASPLRQRRVKRVWKRFLCCGFRCLNKRCEQSLNVNHTAPCSCPSPPPLTHTFFPKEVEQSAAELGAGFSLANNNYLAALVMSHSTHNTTLNRWSPDGGFQQFPLNSVRFPRQKN